MFALCLSQARRRRESVSAESEWLRMRQRPGLNFGVIDAIKMRMDKCADEYLDGRASARYRFDRWDRLRNLVIRNKLPRILSAEECELMSELCNGMFIMDIEVEEYVTWLVAYSRGS